MIQNRVGSAQNDAGIIPTRCTDDTRLSRALNFHGDHLIRVARSRGGAHVAYKGDVIAVQGNEGINNPHDFKANGDALLDTVPRLFPIAHRSGRCCPMTRRVEFAREIGLPLGGTLAQAFQGQSHQLVADASC